MELVVSVRESQLSVTLSKNFEEKKDYDDKLCPICFAVETKVALSCGVFRIYILNLAFILLDLPLRLGHREE
jgi:hypothetical protein